MLHILWFHSNCGWLGHIESYICCDCEFQCVADNQNNCPKCKGIVCNGSQHNLEGILIALDSDISPERVEIGSNDVGWVGSVIVLSKLKMEEKTTLRNQRSYGGKRDDWDMEAHFKINLIWSINLI